MLAAACICVDAGRGMCVHARCACGMRLHARRAFGARANHPRAAALRMQVRERIQDKVQPFVKTCADARPPADKTRAKGDDKSKTPDAPFDLDELETKINEHAEAIRRFTADAVPAAHVDAYMCDLKMCCALLAFSVTINAVNAPVHAHTGAKPTIFACAPHPPTPHAQGCRRKRSHQCVTQSGI